MNVVLIAMISCGVSLIVGPPLIIFGYRFLRWEMNLIKALWQANKTIIQNFDDDEKCREANRKVLRWNNGKI